MNFLGFHTFLVLDLLLSYHHGLKAENFVGERDVKFLLRTKGRDFADQEVFQYDKRDEVEKSSFDPSKPTIFVIHGFLEGPEVKHHIMLSQNLLEHYDPNLFFVDWSIGAKTMIYTVARSRVDEVARVTGGFVNSLHENSGLKYENVTIIGFSLGAHISGVVGKKYVDGKLGRIFGLDPAGPLFKPGDPDSLSSEDAAYTECIHTGYIFGTREAICQTDFYINTGANQPGCVSPAGIDFIPCSHARSIQIFVEAINVPKSFYGDRCPDAQSAIRGYCADQPGAYINDVKSEKNGVTGIFHVTTNAEPPYGRGALEY